METFIRMSDGGDIEVRQDTDVADLVERLEASGDGAIAAIVIDGTVVPPSSLRLASVADIAAAAVAATKILDDRGKFVTWAMWMAKKFDQPVDAAVIEGWEDAFDGYIDGRGQADKTGYCLGKMKDTHPDAEEILRSLGVYGLSVVVDESLFERYYTILACPEGDHFVVDNDHCHDMMR